MGDNITISQSPDAANLIIYPLTDSDISMLSYGASGHYNCLDEIWHSPNENTDYVYNPDESVVSDWYTCTDHTTETGTINYVRGIARSTSIVESQKSTGSFYILINDGSTADKSSNLAPVTVGYKKYYNTWATKPSGGAWTWADIDNILLGLQISSPSHIGDTGATTQLNPSANGDTNEWSTNGGAAWTCVDPDGAGTYIYTSTDEEYDLFQIDDNTLNFGTVNSIKIKGYVHDQANGPQYNFRFLLKINGTVYESTDLQTPAGLGWEWFDYTWTINPDSSASFTWDDIDDLQIGIRLKESAVAVRCSELYAEVNYDYIESPEIRTTQEYAVVNYTPTTSYVSLSMPDQLSVNHSRGVGRFNFPDGDYEIIDTGRSGKALNISGVETSGTVTDMQNMKNMIHYGNKITISGLPDTNLNTDYLIRGFTWNDMSYNDAVTDRTYRYSLQLEEV